MDYLKKDLVLPASQKAVQIREANAYSEQLIFEAEKESIDALVDYWTSLIVSMEGASNPVVRKDFLNLLEPDRIFLGIEIFKLSISKDLTLTSACDKCGDPANFTVNLENLDLIPLPDGASSPDPTFSIKLPRMGHVVVFGYRTGEQEFEEMNATGFNPSRMVWKAIRSVDGDTDVKLAQVMNWPMSDHIVLRKAIVEKQCGYDTRVKFSHKCGKRMVVNILADPSFLAPGLAF